MYLSKQLDYLTLGLTSFFINDALEIGSVSTRPSLLWMYFASRQVRAVMFTGIAGSILYQINNGALNPSKWHYIAVGLLSITSYLNLFNPRFRLSWTTHRDKAEDLGLQSWTTYASDHMGWMGAWWLGGGFTLFDLGNGEWFAFIGHNGFDDKVILPASVLEQMCVGKDRQQEDTGPIVEEMPEEFFEAS